MTDLIFGVVAFVAGVIFGVAGAVMSGSVLCGVAIFAVAFIWALIKMQEGASRGSGYRQEKNQEAILEELRKNNNK